MKKITLTFLFTPSIPAGLAAAPDAQVVRWQSKKPGEDFAGRYLDRRAAVAPEDVLDGVRELVRPSGLQLIDTHSWTVRLLDPHTSSIVLAGGRLFASGYRYDSDGEFRGYGLTIYGPGERRPVHLMGSKAVFRVQVHGDLAYVRANSIGYSVVDLRSNRVLRRERKDLPALLEPNQP